MADPRTAQQIALDGIEHHLVDVERGSRGNDSYNKSLRSRVIRGAIREASRRKDSDHLGPFFVLAALRELDQMESGEQVLSAGGAYRARGIQAGED